MNPIAPWAPDRAIDATQLSLLIKTINDRLAILDAPNLGSGTPLTGALPTDATGMANDVVLGQGVYHEIGVPVATTLTGLVGGFDGRPEVLHNIGQATITLVDEHPSSLATSRFLTRSGSTFAIASGAAALMLYSGTESRWIIIGLLD